MLGVLFMALENLQAGLQEILEFGILSRRDQHGLKCAIDLLVIGDLIFDIGLVEFSPFQFCQLIALSSRSLL